MKLKTLTTLIIIFFSHITVAQADLIFKTSFEFVARLNDTGITWAGDYPSGNSSDCISSTISSPQDCNHGRDFTHNDDSDGHAGFSFTKLDASGKPLAEQSVIYSETPWACVKDNITGLIWEIKTDDGGIHDWDNIYRWGGTTHLGSNYGVYYDDWNSLVDGSNAKNLCGFNDWRVPLTQELMSIVDNSRYNPAIDANYFPNTRISYFWSAMPWTTSSSYAWFVNFSNGLSNTNNRDSSQNLRLVRFQQ